MKLTKAEESKLITEGILGILAILIVGAAMFWAGNEQVERLTEAAAVVHESNQTLLETNRKEAKEIRFLRDNAEAIETIWSRLKGWGDGVKVSNIEPLRAAGLENIVSLPKARIPGNPIPFGGVRIDGNKTEFQRMLVGLGAVEENQGLLQVRRAELKLPPETLPNAAKPTFLDIELEIVAPATK
jgi:hypothetical protein